MLVGILCSFYIALVQLLVSLGRAERDGWPYTSSDSRLVQRIYAAWLFFATWIILVIWFVDL